MFSIEMLCANEGDALWIEYGDPASPRRMLIDCGYKATYRDVMKRFDADPALTLELFVLTHIDGDHISGAVPFIADERVQPANVKEVWFNSRAQMSDTLGVEQAEFFTRDLKDRGFNWNTRFGGHAVAVSDGSLPPPLIFAGELTVTVLSPGREQLRKLNKEWTKELDEIMRNRSVDSVDELTANKPSRLAPDTLGGEVNVAALAATPFDPDQAAPNGSSIAFLAEFKDGDENKAFLFTGDAHAPVLVDSIKKLLRQRGIERLPLTALKVSHHGSAANTSSELLELLNCRAFLISTNGSKFEHPDRECIARIIKSQKSTRLYFNYETDFNRMWNDRQLQRKNNFEACYPAAGSQGLKVEL